MSKQSDKEAGQEIFERAHKDLIAGNIDVSERAFNYLLDRNIQNPDLWFYSGTCQLKRGFNAVAELMFKKCLEIDKNSVAALNNLGTLCKQQQRKDEAESYFRKALKFFPKNCEPEVERELGGIWNNLSTLYIENGTPDKAIEYCNAGLKYQPASPQLLWNRALAHLEKKEWEAGWYGYDSGFKSEDGKRKDKPYSGNIPHWDGSPGMTVIIYGEQGLGDEILFSSMIDDASRRASIIIDAHPRLANIFRNSFPGIPIYGTRKDNETPWTELFKIDARCAIGSLGKLFRKKDSDFPMRERYLFADKRISEKYREKLSLLGNRPKIGISWKGGYPSTGKKIRSIDLKQWGPILSIDADFISLQYTSKADEEAIEAEEFHGIKIHHWQDTIDDYDETAGLVDNLDLVVTITTSIAHLAGAMGKKTLVLTPSKNNWNWGLSGSEMIWYPSITLFRQIGNDWNPVIRKISEEICHLFQKTTAA